MQRLKACGICPAIRVPPPSRTILAPTKRTPRQVSLDARRLLFVGQSLRVQLSSLLKMPWSALLYMQTASALQHSTY